ncbi:hypothetical protein [Parapedobacter defluvii]|uniref:hypothetical protein n=1 Tax=Parapedobacter defluvii TaxID=2045106 RepID=UPI0033401039
MNRRKFIQTSTLVGCSTVMLGATNISCSKHAGSKPEQEDGTSKNYRISVDSGALKVMP